MGKGGDKVEPKEGNTKISCIFSHFKQHYVKSWISEEGNLGSLKKQGTEEEFGGRKLQARFI